MFVLDNASLITLDDSLNEISKFYFLPQDIVERNTSGGFLIIEKEVSKQKYYNNQHYFEYNYNDDSINVGLYNKPAIKYDLYTIDKENGTLEGLTNEKLIAEERSQVVEELLSKQKEKTIEE